MTDTLTRPAATDTDKVLAGMFTENTGRHFLDSGGAYGRNWERNAGREVEDFLAAPEAWLDQYGEYVVVDAFHWLRERLEYAPREDAIFHRWVDMCDPDSYWLQSMETFAELVQGAPLGSKYLDGTINTYNGECNLSTTLQWTMFEADRPGWDGETYVLLQVHGGCDVRGGYTAPRVFRVTTYEAGDMYDVDNFELSCTKPHEVTEPLPGMPDEPYHYLSYRHEWITPEGSCATDSDLWPDEDDRIMEDEAGVKHFRCPFCTDPTPMTVHPGYVS